MRNVKDPNHQPGHSPGALKRAIGAGLALSLACGLGQLSLPAAQAADPVVGGQWSTTYETGQPQSLVDEQDTAPVGLRGETEGAHSLIDAAAVYSPTPNTSSSTEHLASLLDKNPSTKWYVNLTTAASTLPISAVYPLTAPTVVTGYSLTSANDNSNRNPKAWTVYGSNTASAATNVDDASWVAIDSRTNQTFSNFHQRNFFTITTPGSYQYYLLKVTQLNGETIRFQIADWTLLSWDGATASTLSTSVQDPRGVSSTVGSGAVRYSGANIAAGHSSTVNTLHSGLDVLVGSDTGLQYSVFPSSAESTPAAVDVEYTDADGSNAARLSASGLLDSNGTAVTAAAHASSFTPGQWNTVNIDLSSLVCKKITKVLLSYDNTAAHANTAFSGFVDNITVGANPFVGPLALTPKTLPTLRDGYQVYSDLASLTGTGVTSGAATASINLNDGSAAVPLTLTATGSGATLSFPSSFSFTKPGRYSATLSASNGSDTVSAPVTLDVSRDRRPGGGIASAANVACLTVSGTAADCDGNTYAFDKAKLSALGVVQGTENSVTLGGTAFYYHLPSIASGSRDTIFPAGQKVSTSLNPGTTSISFLGFANEGTRSTTVTLHFTDGTTQAVPVSFGDWVGAATTPISGNSVVANTVGRLMGSSGSDAANAAIFATTPVTLDSVGGTPKTVSYLEFAPQSGVIKPDGQVHIVAWATDGAPVDVGADLTATVPEAATVSLGSAYSGALTTVSGGLGAYSATVNWGDGSPLQNATVAGTEVTGSHTYAAGGTYTATITVATGALSTTVTKTITVRYLPTLVAPTTAVDLGNAVALSGTGYQPGATVTFAWAGASPLTQPWTAVADSSGELTTTSPVLPAEIATGSYTVTASGDSWDPVSATVLVNHITSATATTITAPSEPQAVGSAITLTATVTSSLEGTAGPSGTVQFHQGTDVLGDPVAVTGHTASLTTSELPLGAHSVTAQYVGDANYASSTSAAVTVDVVKKASHTQLSGIPASIQVGTTIPVSVAVTPVGATGTVEILDGASPLGTFTLDPTTSTVSVPLNTLSVGDHSLSATYSGDASHQVSTSDAVSTTVTAKSVPAATVARPVFSKASQVFGSVMSKRARVSVVVSGVTSGTVTFRSGSVVWGSAKVVRSGSSYSASLVVPGSLKVGSYAGVTASLVSGSVTAVSAKSAVVFKVVKASTSVKVKGKAFKKGSKPKVTVTVAKLSSGVYASGTVKVYVGKKAVKKVKVTAKKKGKVTVTLPKRYGKTVRVKATFVPSSASTVAGATSKSVKVKVKK